MKRRYHIQEQQDVKEMYKNGLSPEKISEILPQYTPYQIREFLKDNGCFNERHVITDELLQAMINDYESGISFVDMSKKYGFSAVTIGNNLRKCKKNKNQYYQRVTKDKVLQALSILNLKLIDNLSDVGINSQKIHACDIDGYKYVTTWSLLKNGHLPLKFSPNNKYSIENINILLDKTRNGEYYCPLCQEYNGNDKELIFIHKPCGNKLISTLAAMQGKTINQHYRYFKQCRYCYPEKIESTHASVLKQVFIHEYPSTVTEDRSCINPNTNRALPTDIVNHDLKIVVEVQSSYHDDEYKQTLDSIKKQFWIDKGYNYYCPDIRDYSVLEMIQLFFPQIKEIPDYIDYHYSDVFDYHLIQDVLNQGYTVKETSEILNIPTYTIHNANKKGTVVIPEASKRKAIKAKGLVHLSKDGTFIKEYDYLNDISKDNYALGSIQRVLRGQQKFAYNSYWVYSDDYYNGNYKIPDEMPDKYNVPVISINQDNVEYYSDIYEAANHFDCHPYKIYNVLMGKQKSLMGYQFRFNQ